MAREAFLFSHSNLISSHAERWLSSRDAIVNRWVYVQAVRNFARVVKMVAGEANGQLFNREELVSVLGEGLRENPQSTVHLVFHKADDKNQATVAFKEENPLLVALKNKFPDRVHIFWAPKRAKQHYAVIDDDTVIFEQPNHPANKSWWGNIVEDATIAEEWERRFDEYAGYCSELHF